MLNRVSGPVLRTRGSLRRRFRNPRVERVQRVLMFRKLIDRCKRQKNCPYCGEYNATVKWVAVPLGWWDRGCGKRLGTSVRGINVLSCCSCFSS